MMNKDKFEFSPLGFFIGCFFFILSFVLLHEYWIGAPFESALSVLTTIYLGSGIWTFANLLNALDEIDDFFTRKPLGFSIMKGVYIIFYFISPITYIGLKFF